jgi:hypothetical protein
VTHTESGCQKDETFRLSLHLLRVHMGAGSTRHLEKSPFHPPRSHRCVLAPRPEGIQVLEVKAKPLFHERAIADPMIRRTKQGAVQNMITAWSNVGEDQRIEAPEIFNPDD